MKRERFSRAKSAKRKSGSRTSNAENTNQSAFFVQHTQ